jgi:putative FmdB family regulatory protein
VFAHPHEIYLSVIFPMVIILKTRFVWHPIPVLSTAFCKWRSVRDPQEGEGCRANGQNRLDLDRQVIIVLAKKEGVMPIFEFQCNACGHQFERLVFASDTEPPVCPACSCADVQKLMSAGSVRPNGIPTGGGGFTPPACKISAGG